MSTAFDKILKVCARIIVIDWGFIEVKLSAQVSDTKNQSGNCIKDNSAEKTGST